MRQREALESRGDLSYAAHMAGQEACERRMRELMESTPDWYVAKAWSCPQCGTAFSVKDGYEMNYLKRAGCACGQEAARLAEAKFTKEHWAEVVASLWINARIPRRFDQASFANFKKREGATAALAACQQYVKEFTFDTAIGLFLAGGYGAGKTHLVTATARALIEKSLVQVYFATTGALFERLKASDFDRSELEQATKAEVLILDDLAQDWLSTYDRGVLFTLINERYERMKPTFFTTNASAKDLEAMIGGALYSRLCEMADLVRLTASDYRRRTA